MTLKITNENEHLRRIIQPICVFLRQESMRYEIQILLLVTDDWWNVF